jgi:hypothetical protein
VKAFFKNMIQGEQLCTREAAASALLNECAANSRDSDFNIEMHWLLRKPLTAILFMFECWAHRPFMANVPSSDGQLEHIVDLADAASSPASSKSLDMTLVACQKFRHRKGNPTVIVRQASYEDLCHFLLWRRHLACIWEIRGRCI